MSRKEKFYSRREFRELFLAGILAVLLVLSML